MSVKERNNLIDQAIIDYKICHDKHFPVGRSLTDKEWKDLIDEMNAVADKYKPTNIVALSGKLCMAFLDDIEMVHKMWLAKEQK